MNGVDVSVVVCTYNRSARLIPALESLLAQDTGDRLTYEIVAVDDGSTDNTADVLADFMSRDTPAPVRRVQGEGRGVAEARNAGIRAAGGRWIAFFDDDQRAETQWLSELHEVATRCDADCVGGTLLLELPETCHVRLESRCRDLLCERVMGSEVIRYPKGEYPATNNVIIRRDVFSRVGLFDSRMQYATEDTDFFKRAEGIGAATWYSPRAIAYHIIPESRLNTEFFKHGALVSGLSEARIRYQYHGWLSCLMGLPRPILRAVLRDIWLLLAARLRRDPGGILERKCRLWETVGQVRASLAFLLPWLAPQRSFFEKLNFRKRGTGRAQRQDKPAAEPVEIRC